MANPENFSSGPQKPLAVASPYPSVRGDFEHTTNLPLVGKPEPVIGPVIIGYSLNLRKPDLEAPYHKST